jgi:hypothetical protein
MWKRRGNCVRSCGLFDFHDLRRKC